MERDAIAEVGIDDEQRLYVLPATRSFPYIYREAMEIQWEPHRRYLYSPVPPRGSIKPLAWWYQQILRAALAQSCELHLTGQTRWHQIPEPLKQELARIGTV